jgi:hypothetical protein
MNTWENLFFDTYRPKYGSAGFRVDGWTAVGGPEVWTSGGVVAEATWTGHCGSTFILGCTDHTTFKLTAVVTGTAPASSVPLASVSDAELPLITPQPLGGGAAPIATLPPDLAAGGLPGACTDFQSCLSQYAIFIIIGGIVLLGGGLLLWQRLASTGDDGFPTENLADKIAPIDSSKYDTAGTLDADKIAPIGETLPPLEPSSSPLPPPPGSSLG